MEQQDFTAGGAVKTNGRSRAVRRWLTSTAIVAGGITIGGLAFTHGGSTPAAASAASGSGTATSLANLASTTSSNPIPGPRGLGKGAMGARGFGGGLTVTGISGNTITATTRGGATITITVNSSTTYDEAGASVTLAAVQSGQRISLRGSSTGTNAVTATSIAIVLPVENGVVTNVSGTTVTITSFDGSTHVINLETGTRYQKAGATEGATDVTSGTAITATGPTNSDGSLNADLVTINVPRLSGQVTTSSNGSYTITGRDGGTDTISTTSGTVYVNADGTAAQASAITTGTTISAEGTLSADGKTLTALRITILPAKGISFGPGGRGGWGQGGAGSAVVPGSGSGTSTSGAAAGTGV
ncbi:MAG TPA: hypothetical protein VN837_18795 [Chloroflexota bacterium]|nr:hypothetical protein [Chloroflexota bacterium]